MVERNKIEESSKCEEFDVLEELVRFQFSNKKVIIVNRQFSI